MRIDHSLNAMYVLNFNIRKKNKGKSLFITIKIFAVDKMFIKPLHFIICVCALHQ